jgi:hypothetical protein
MADDTPDVSAKGVSEIAEITGEQETAIRQTLQANGFKVEPRPDPIAVHATAILKLAVYTTRVYSDGLLGFDIRRELIVAATAALRSIAPEGIDPRRFADHVVVSFLGGHMTDVADGLLDAEQVLTLTTVIPGGVGWQYQCPHVDCTDEPALRTPPGAWAHADFLTEFYNRILTHIREHRGA